MFNNFIGVYENVLPAPNCQDLIDFFETSDKLGLTYSRQQKGPFEHTPKTLVHDDQLLLPSTCLELAHSTVIKDFVTAFWNVPYKKYAEEYDVIQGFDKHTVYSFKMQRTQIGGGFHYWHAEQTNKASSDRFLTFTCYLNDVDEGGETEFLYYPKRVKATQGTFLLFPGGFTHTHRGNPPISNTKYIVTGWVQFCS